MKEGKNIGMLFKSKLQNYEAQVEHEEWDQLGMKLDRMRFFRFSISHFNIYYCSAIALCLFLSSAVFIKEVFYDRGNLSLVQPSSINRENAPFIIKDSSVLKTKTEVSKIETPQKTSSVPPKINEPEVDAFSQKETERDTINEIISSPAPQPKDTILSDSVIPQEKSIEALKSKNVVHIIKQDTIIVLDTLSKKKTKRRK